MPKKFLEVDDLPKTPKLTPEEVKRIQEESIEWSLAFRKLVHSIEDYDPHALVGGPNCPCQKSCVNTTVK